MQRDPVPPASHQQTRENDLLTVLFFLSGTAALIYQVCWQRLLFGAFGVDMDSITIIVSTFMLGLGLGALAGGKLADKFPYRIIGFFAVIEWGIGLFGLCSPPLIRWVGDAFVASPRPVIALINFALIALPATFMGATLPMLVAHVFRYQRNIGVSIGKLYFMNTFGAAIGAAATGFILFKILTLDQTVIVAVILNFSIGTLVVLNLRAKGTA